MPPETLTLKDLIVQRQTMQGACAAAGITATLECEPSIVVGRAPVRVRAQFFASAEILATLAPVLRSEEQVESEGIEMHPVGSEGVYRVTLPAGSLHADRVYHLTVYPAPGGAAHARVTLRTFSRRTAAVVRSALRAILDSSKVRVSAASPRGGRPSRRRST